MPAKSRTDSGRARSAWRWLVPAFVMAVSSSSGSGARGQDTLSDPRFEELRRAASTWERRTGPERQVVDMVCLVPDEATFFEAIAAWDEHHYFPVLIDEVESTFRFLRAFRPSRVVRYPGRASGASGPGANWAQALTAVGKAWVSDDTPANEVPRGDVLPESFGATPPGVVVTSDESPSLAGAAALAAGRFQPLLRWEVKKTFDDVLTIEEAFRLSRELEAVIAVRRTNYEKLGDDVDFVTLAGPYPFRFAESKGQSAFDDLILRSNQSHRRWGFAGRLMGGPALSVFRAMCSLFLRPGPAVMFNTYDEKTRPWSDYAMRSAASRLDRVVPTGPPRIGFRAEWHPTFDPTSKYGLILVNSQGGPTYYAHDGQTADIPAGRPAAVHFIHSYSAVAPHDPDTLAGRWLANGAFVYFGAMGEPYLQAFRTPSLVVSCLAENYPMAAAFRKQAFEPFGHPWRLAYFGDPLYRVTPIGQADKRLASWPPVADWPAYGEFQQPVPAAPESLRLNWALKTAIFRFQTGVTSRQQVDITPTLLGIARDRLDVKLRPVYDDLIVDTLRNAGRLAELIDRLSRVPPSERSTTVRRHLESVQTVVLQRAITLKDFRQCEALWAEVVRAEGSTEFVKTFTTRVGDAADTPVRQTDWLSRLRAAKRASAEPKNEALIDDELKRIAAKRIPGGRG